MSDRQRGDDLEDESDDALGGDAPVEIPIDGVLDLHTFAPRDVKELVTDYVEECWARGMREVRIIHGKGTGTLRRIVHGVLERHARVVGFRGGEGGEGGWGSTVATLRDGGRAR